MAKAKRPVKPKKAAEKKEEGRKFILRHPLHEELKGLIDETATLISTNGDELYNHSYGRCIGQRRIINRDDPSKDIYESYYTKDAETSTELFDKVRALHPLVTKYHNLYNGNTNTRYQAERYYMMYDAVDTTANTPTFRSECLSRAMNMSYKVQYEVHLVVDDGYERFVTLDYATRGPYTTSFFSQVEDLERTFEELMEEGKLGFFMAEGELEDELEGKHGVTFYNEMGEPLKLGFHSMSELMMSVHSIRILNIESEMDK